MADSPSSSYLDETRDCTLTRQGLQVAIDDHSFVFEGIFRSCSSIPGRWISSAEATVIAVGGLSHEAARENLGRQDERILSATPVRGPHLRSYWRWTLCRADERVVVFSSGRRGDVETIDALAPLSRTQFPGFAGFNRTCLRPHTQTSLGSLPQMIRTTQGRFAHHVQLQR